MTELNNALTVTQCAGLQIPQEIQNAQDYRVGEKVLRSVIALRKEIAANYDPAIKAAKDAVRAVQEAKLEQDGPLAEVETTLRDIMSHYLAQEAENMAASRQLAGQVAAQTFGSSSEEDSLEAAAMLGISLVDDVEKAGVETNTRTTYKAEVVDLFVLVQAVAKREVSMACVEANQPKLNELARRLKEEFAIPGCTLAKKVSVAMKKEGG